MTARQGPRRAFPDPLPAIASGSGPATGAWAEVRYAARPWGTELEVQVTGIPAGTRCRLVVTGAQGQDLAAGGWTIAVLAQQFAHVKGDTR